MAVDSLAPVGCRKGALAAAIGRGGSGGFGGAGAGAGADWAVAVAMDSSGPRAGGLPPAAIVSPAELSPAEVELLGAEARAASPFLASSASAFASSALASAKALSPGADCLAAGVAGGLAAGLGATEGLGSEDRTVLLGNGVKEKFGDGARLLIPPDVEEEGKFAEAMLPGLRPALEPAEPKPPGFRPPGFRPSALNASGLLVRSPEGVVATWPDSRPGKLLASTLPNPPGVCFRNGAEKSVDWLGNPSAVLQKG